MRPRIKQQAIATAEAELLRRLRSKGGVSRVELAREMNLAPSTVGSYVDRLIHEGFLCEGARVDGSKGRPPTRLALNPDGGRFVGVDIEARNILALAVDFSQQPLTRVRHKLRAGDTLPRVLALLEESIDEAIAGDARPVLGIGVGVPGTIDPRTGVARHYAHIEGWHNVPLAERLSKRFGVPVYLENNIRSMALAEQWFGQGLGLDHFVTLGVRSGIAAGVVVAGQLYQGHDHLAGQIATWPCPPMATGGHDVEPRFAPIAPWLPLEERASTRSILREVAARRGAGAKTAAVPAELEWTDVVQATAAGDPVVAEVIRSAADALGTVIGQVALLLNPELVILAGPLTELGAAFLEQLGQRASQLVPSHQTQMPRITYSNLGEHAGALGAAGLAVQHWQPAR